MSNANRFGEIFQVTSFGESHGEALGAVIEGCPAGIRFDEALLQNCLDRRRPGTAAGVSARQEPDRAEILSGIFEGRTLGTPICVVVRNQDARPKDYDAVAIAPRAGHADDVWREKFGHSDHRGGGRSSGRETLVRVIGGAFAQMFLRESHPKLIVNSFLQSLGPMQILIEDRDANLRWGVRTEKFAEIEKFLLGLKTEGDSVGGVAEVVVNHVPKNLGQPVAHKLKADLTAAYMSIGATTGVELGGGFSLAHKKGTEVHGTVDSEFTAAAGSAIESSVYGGIRGGISTGEPIVMRVAFKPTSSILDVAKRGRHDPCIVPRALPVLEAMTYMVLADHVLWSRLDRAT
jgi:chorismate synthase